MNKYEFHNAEIYVEHGHHPNDIPSIFVVEDDEVYQIMYNPSLQFDVRSEGKLGERYGYDQNNKLTYIGFSSHYSDRIDDHNDKQ